MKRRTSSDSADVRKQLEKLGHKPQRTRGQNFLHDRTAIQQVLDFAAVTNDEAVLEIGPGLGALTFSLARDAKRLYLVEIEPQFCAALLREIPDLDPEQVYSQDFRTLSLSSFVPPLVLVSNVPYSVSTELVNWAIEWRSVFARISLLLQREFAERVAAVPGGRSYGSLSVFCSVFCTAELGEVISGDCFVPEAEVDSQLLRLTPRIEPLVPTAEQEGFFSVVRAAFSHRRKTILNSIVQHSRQMASELGSKEKIVSALQAARISPGQRAETVSVEQFLELSRELISS